MLPPELSQVDVPPPVPAVEPEGFIVLVEPAERIHFLDWGGPGPANASGAGTDIADAGTGAGTDGPGVLLIHGLAATAWTWTPVARRLCVVRRTVAIDLRGHGLSDAPTGPYDPDVLVEDAVAVADGARLLSRPGGLVLAGHGFGAAVAAWTAAALGDRCTGLVLVDGGWEDQRDLTDLEPAEFVRQLEEPPEVLRSMDALLADREAFDPASWDDDQERAARASVVELPAGRVVPAIRPHALEAAVHAMFAYRPRDVLARLKVPIVALVADEAADEDGLRRGALRAAEQAVVAAGRPPMTVVHLPAGHNLIRYRPASVTAAVLAVARPGPA